MKLSKIVLAFAMIAATSSSFAADYATDLTGTVDVATEAAAASLLYVSTAAAATDPYATNVALIQQTTNDTNLAVIDQAGATTSFAAILQAGSASVGYINQTSANNFAYIKQ